MKTIDIRNIPFNETVTCKGWLITRVVGGWLYRERSPETTAVTFVPMVADILGGEMIIEIE